MGWKRFVGWVREDSPSYGGRPPVDPGYGVEGPVDPGYGVPGDGPVDPGYGWPGGGRPTHPIAPGGGGGRPSHPIAKPPGFPILPVDPSWGVPVGPPSFPGDWIPVDPGYGLPPILGWRPVDPGFGVPVAPGTPTQPIQPVPPGTPTQPIAPVPPPGTPTHPIAGHWVPVDPGYGVSQRCPDAVVNPLWVWIAEIGPGFGLRPKPQPK
jgi:hypothetical protein